MERFGRVGPNTNQNYSQKLLLFVLPRTQKPQLRSSSKRSFSHPRLLHERTGASSLSVSKYHFPMCQASWWTSWLWCPGECCSEPSLMGVFPPALSQRSCHPAHCYCGVFTTQPVAYRFLGAHRWGGPVITAVHLHCVSYPSKIG